MENYHSEVITEPVEERKKSTRSGCLNFAVDTLETVLLALVLFFGINAVSARVRVENISMQPTLHANEFVLVNKLAYKLGQPQIGDIIIFHYPLDPKEDFVKRVIGLPGDTVKVEDGTVYVNGHALIEPYIAAKPNYTGTWNVPPDSLFVLGDNRNQSSDSHSWGFVPMNYVVGKAIVIYWPLNEMQVLEHATVVSAAQ